MISSDQNIKNIFRDAGKYLSASLLSKAIGFFTLPVYTRLFGIEGYGEYSLYLVFFSFSMLIFEIGAIKTLTRKWYDFQSDDERLVFIFRVFKSHYFLNFLLCLIILLFLNDFISDYFKVRSMTVIIGVLSAFFYLPVQYTLMYFQLTKKSTFYGILTLSADGLIKLITVFTFLAQISFGNYIYNEGTIRIIAYFLFLIAIFLAAIREKNNSFTVIIKYSSLLGSAIFLFFHNASTMMMGISDRLIINRYQNLAQTSYYSLIYDTALILSLITTGLAVSYVPRLFEALKKTSFDYAKQIHSKIIRFVFWIAVFITAFSSELILLLGGPDYLKYQPLFYINILSIFFLVLYTFNSNVIYFFGYNKTLALTSFGCAVMNIVLNVIFIPVYGIYAASFSTLLAYMLLYLITSLFVYHKVNRESFRQQLFQNNTIYILIISLISLFHFLFFQNPTIAWFIVKIIIILFVLIISRNKIRLLYSHD